MSKTILILGASGMLGHEIKKQLSSLSHVSLLSPSHAELNLTDQAEVEDYFSKHKIDQIYFCAAQVGNVESMKSMSYQILEENLLIQQNTIACAFRNKIKKIIFCSSSCIYPEDEERAMKEEDILAGSLPVAQKAYGLSKVAGTVLCQSYNRQYQTQYITIVPCAIYGGLESLRKVHPQVMPAMIKRMADTIKSNDKTFVVWGSGGPIREFIHVKDVAAAAIFLMNKEQLSTDTYNVGSGELISIGELAQLVATKFGYDGKIVFDQSKSDGAKYKSLSCHKIEQEGWKAKISLNEGLSQFISDYCKTI